ncbi:MAG: trigger factor [Solirubrobacteraceae bacterium]|nr:trigger factor [Solirubrobacteraceae bacterium]MEA2398632.1 trigger factor [Thermoleophilaceae bacterium]
MGGSGRGTCPRYRGAAMPTQVTTETKDLGDSRVRVEVEVASDALERELDTAARNLGRELKIPGFRKGKVPPEVVIRRVGRDAVLDEAVRHALPNWYEQAVHDAGIAAVGDPSLDLAELPEKGSPLQFSIEVAVRPKAELGDYKGLEVGRGQPEVPADQVDAEVERLRESAASLENVERPASAGDFVVIDFTGTVDGEPFEGGEARGYLLELGSGRLIEGFEEQLQGASPGDDREVRVKFPDDYGAESLAGQDAVFAVSVKEVKEKRLPELDDELATEAGGFDTLDELRADIEQKLREARERELEVEFREAVVDAAAEAATIDVTHDLVHAKAHEMWASTRRRLERQGIPPDRYLQITGKTEEELVTEAEPDAERALRRESVLTAVVEAEGIEAADDELLDSLRQATVAGGGAPDDKELQKALDRAKADGRDDALREDIAMRKAVDLLVEHAKPIPVDQAEARDKLWTPEKEGKEKGKGKAKEPAEKIWTPGS